MSGAPFPSGVVTLLFVDIEDSTGHVQRLGAGYIRVLEEFRAVVRGAVAEAGGHEVDCRADELFAAFDRPESAVAAAVSAQKLLARAAVKARMGIHTGKPALAGETYFGVDVHRAARICDAGHGGQILVSADTHAALDGALEVRDLGTHELRGLPGPERILQLVGRRARG